MPADSSGCCKRSDNGVLLEELGFAADVHACGELDTVPVVPRLDGNVLRLRAGGPEGENGAGALREKGRNASTYQTTARSPAAPKKETARSNGNPQMGDPVHSADDACAALVFIALVTYDAADEANRRRAVLPSLGELTGSGQRAAMLGDPRYDTQRSGRSSVCWSPIFSSAPPSASASSSSRCSWCCGDGPSCAAATTAVRSP